MAGLRYKLDDLGWLSFEQLCQTLLKIRFGFGIEAWSGSGDWGRDAYFEGKLSYPCQKPTQGAYIFQCKFVSEANATGAKPYSSLKGAIKAETKRIKAHLKSGRWTDTPDHYALLTNSRISTSQRKELQNILLGEIPNTEIHLHSGSDFCAWLDAEPQVLRSFPQLYTVRDLDQLVEDILDKVVNSETLERSREALLYAKEKASVFVETAAYSKALTTLSSVGFIVLEGPPEMGKTTIGRVIALGQAVQGWEAYECRRPEEILKLYKRDKSQVFVADDFFGRTEYEPQRVSAWQSELSHILPKLDKSHWLILTCRAHLLEMGKSRLDVAEFSDKFPTIGEVVVDAGRLTEIERAKILYRHAKKSNLNDDLKSIIRSNAEAIIRSSHYTPERIRRLSTGGLSDAVLSKNIEIEKSLLSSLSEPTKQMEKSFATLDVSYRWALFSLLGSGSGVSDEEAYQKICPDKYKTSHSNAFDPLTEGFIKVGFMRYQWIHPSCRDLTIKLLSQRLQDRRRFLKTCPISGLALACSVGGGSKGEVSLPLLVDDKDWAIFEDRVTQHLKLHPEHFHLIWNNYKALQSTIHTKNKLNRFTTFISSLSNIFPEKFKNLTYDALDELESLIAISNHYNKQLSFTPQWKICVIRAEEWAEDKSYVFYEDTYHLEKFVEFAEYVDQWDERQQSNFKWGIKLTSIIMERCIDEWQQESLIENIESESDASDRIDARDIIMNALSTLAQCSWSKGPLRHKLGELAKKYRDLNIEPPDSTLDNDDYISHDDGTHHVNIANLFLDL